MRSASSDAGLSPFARLFLGQTASMLGSGLSGFALGLFFLQETGSVTLYTLASMFVALPGVLALPVTGALIDRFDRRRLMLLSDIGAGFCALLLALLVFTESAESWHIYTLTMISALLGAFQWPAYCATVTLLVPPRRLGQASALVQLGGAAKDFIAPALAGLFVASVGIHGLLFIDTFTFLFSALVLLWLRLPKERAERPERPIREEILFGFRYIWERPGFLLLQLFFLLSLFLNGVSLVLMLPMLLTFSSVSSAGIAISISSLGIIFGTVAISAWRSARHRIVLVLAAEALSGVTLILAVVRPSLVLAAAGGFLFLFALGVSGGASQAIWQLKVPAALQGRVFAIRKMIAWAGMPLAFLVAGPLAEHIFEPLMRSGGALASSMGLVLGVGPGRGIALLIIVMGVGKILLSVIAWYSRQIRFLEENIPNAERGE